MNGDSDNDLARWREHASRESTVAVSSYIADHVDDTERSEKFRAIAADVRGLLEQEQPPALTSEGMAQVNREVISMMQVSILATEHRLDNLQLSPEERAEKELKIAALHREIARRTALEPSGT